MTTCTDPDCNLPPPPGPNDVPTAIAALCANLIRACDEYNLLRAQGLSDKEIGALINNDLRKLPDIERVQQVYSIATRLERGAEAESTLAAITAHAPPMHRVIERLMTDAPKLTDAAGTPVPNQSPALDCVVMFANGQAVRGSLSKTPEGTLRLLSPGQEDQRPVLVEQFFDYGAVSAVAITRDVAPAGSRILIPRGGVAPRH